VVCNSCIAHSCLSYFSFFLLQVDDMTQVVKRKSTPQTKAGQYMCPECGEVFNTKKHVDRHLYIMHEVQIN
jgi:hypothetical protein